MIGGGQFVPPSVDKLTIDMPGFAGGGEWGGAAVDPIDRSALRQRQRHCVAGWPDGSAAGWECGREGLSEPMQRLPRHQPGGLPASDSRPCGVSRASSLNRRSPATIRGGKGRMPPFNSLSDEQVQAVVRYLTKAPQQQQRPPRPARGGAACRGSVAAEGAGGKTTDDMPYKTIGFRRFTDPEGYPATAPPWGTLSAIDLNTGKYLWKIPFGTYPELVAKGMADTGSDNYGGPVVTEGGLLFIGASVFRSEVPRLRQGHRQAALGNRIALLRSGDTCDLHGERKAIRRDRSRRRAIEQKALRWCVRRLRATVDVSVSGGWGPSICLRGQISE